jgi:PAS domain S-box-containing protein
VEDKSWTLYRISKIDATQIAFDAGVFLFVNMDYTIEWSTPEANKLFGYISGELDGKKLEILIPPDKRKTHLGHFKKFFDTPEDRNMGANIKQSVFDGYKRDGSIIRVSILIRMCAVDGKRISVAMIFPVL